MSRRFLGQLRCDHVVTTTTNGRTMLKCREGKSEFPLYPVARLARMVAECSRCDSLTVTCVECGHATQ